MARHTPERLSSFIDGVAGKRLTYKTLIAREAAMRFDRNKFMAWLKTKLPNEIVGVARDSCGCPLARFYEETSGGSEVLIFDAGDCHIADRGYSRLPLPRWAQGFVRNIDDEEPYDHQVEAWRAIQLLEAA